MSKQTQEAKGKNQNKTRGSEVGRKRGTHVCGSRSGSTNGSTSGSGSGSGGNRYLKEILILGRIKIS